MMVGRLLSFWDGLFSGAMLNFQGVVSGNLLHAFCFLPEIPGCCGCNLFFVDKNLDDYTPEKITNVLKKGAISKGKDRLPTTIFGGCNHSWYLYLGSQKWIIAFL